MAATRWLQSPNGGMYRVTLDPITQEEKPMYFDFECSSGWHISPWTIKSMLSNGWREFSLEELIESAYLETPRKRAALLDTLI